MIWDSVLIAVQVDREGNYIKQSVAEATLAKIRIGRGGDNV